MSPSSPTQNNPALHRFAIATAVAALGLIALGGLVTSRGVGMAVPDWPNTYGYNMFFFPVSQWIGGVFYEHAHRLAASSVGGLTCALALWLHGRPARRFMRFAGALFVVLAVITVVRMPARRADCVVLVATGGLLLGGSALWPRTAPSSKLLRRLGLAAVAAVILQGVLGGLRVVWFKDQIGIFHAVLAQMFLVLLCVIAWLSRPGFGSRRPIETSAPRLLYALFASGTLLILGQLALGATMRHEHAGLAIPDFPLAYGRVWPAMDPASVALYNQHRLEVVPTNAITATQIGLQMAHRLTALMILGVVGAAAWAARAHYGPRHPVARLALLWLTAIGVQVVLGAVTIWSGKAAALATGHVVVGALSLVAGAFVCLRAYPRAAERPVGDALPDRRFSPSNPAGLPSLAGTPRTPVLSTALPAARR